MPTWDEDARGVLRLPSGRLVRGRAGRRGVPCGAEPDLSLCLQRTAPAPTPWATRWVRWPDWWLPLDSSDAHDALSDAWRRAGDERVEVVCRGGRGRTGTALACLAVLDGVQPGEAVRFVREQYDARAVETPWQRRYVLHCSPRATT